MWWEQGAVSPGSPAFALLRAVASEPMSALPGALGTSLKAIYRGTRDEKPSEDFTVEGKKGTL